LAPSSNPPQLHNLVEELKPLSAGVGVCGAGAGGYIVIILKRNISYYGLMDKIISLNQKKNATEHLSLHRINMDYEGLEVSEVSSNDILLHLIS
jgi:hypothetical protein